MAANTLGPRSRTAGIYANIDQQQVKSDYGPTERVIKNLFDWETTLVREGRLTELVMAKEARQAIAALMLRSRWLEKGHRCVATHCGRARHKDDPSQHTILERISRQALEQMP